MDKLIWTPSFNIGYDFRIDLDWNFAREMVQSRIPAERQVRMNALANEELKRLGGNWSNPYSFYEDSCFVSQIYTGQNGVWLSTNHKIIDSLIKCEKSEPIIYDSHNVDTSHQAHVLMVLFDKWIKYSRVIRE